MKPDYAPLIARLLAYAQRCFATPELREHEPALDAHHAAQVISRLSADACGQDQQDLIWWGGDDHEFFFDGRTWVARPYKHPGFTKLQFIVNFLRDILARGATISAVNPEVPTLQLGDGDSISGGLCIDYDDTLTVAGIAKKDAEIARLEKALVAADLAFLCANEAVELRCADHNDAAEEWQRRCKEYKARADASEVSAQAASAEIARLESQLNEAEENSGELCLAGHEWKRRFEASESAVAGLKEVIMEAHDVLDTFSLPKRDMCHDGLCERLTKHRASDEGTVLEMVRLSSQVMQLKRDLDCKWATDTVALQDENERLREALKEALSVLENSTSSWPWSHGAAIRSARGALRQEAP